MFSMFKKKPEAAESELASPIYPRLRNKEYLEKLASVGISPGELPIAEDLVGDLQLLFGIDEGSTFQLITPRKLEALHLSRESIRDAATQTCAGFLDAMEVHARGPVHRLTGPHSLAGCSILLPSFWAHLASDLGGPAVLAVASQDEIFYVRDQPDGIAALRELLGEEDYAEPLSGFLYRLDRMGGWSVYASI